MNQLDHQNRELGKYSLVKGENLTVTTRKSNCNYLVRLVVSTPYNESKISLDLVLIRKYSICILKKHKLAVVKTGKSAHFKKF